MGNATWVKQAVRGTVIATEAGERATVTDLSDGGATLHLGQSDTVLTIPMQDIRATIALWARLRVPPSPGQVREAGIADSHAAYLVPMIAAVRRAPGIQEWVHADRIERRGGAEVELRKG